MVLQFTARQLGPGAIFHRPMNELRIGTVGNKTAYHPGEEILGAAGWKLDQQPRSVDGRLFWHTDGQGTRDVGIAHTIKFDQPEPEDARQFRLVAPGAPVSFSGKLISLIWSLELVVSLGKDCAGFDIAISPGGQEIFFRAQADQNAKMQAARGTSL